MDDVRGRGRGRGARMNRDTTASFIQRSRRSSSRSRCTSRSSSPSLNGRRRSKSRSRSPPSWRTAGKGRSRQRSRSRIRSRSRSFSRSLSPLDRRSRKRPPRQRSRSRGRRSRSRSVSPFDERRRSQRSGSSSFRISSSEIVNSKKSVSDSKDENGLPIRLRKDLRPDDTDLAAPSEHQSNPPLARRKKKRDIPSEFLLDNVSKPAAGDAATKASSVNVGGIPLPRALWKPTVGPNPETKPNATPPHSAEASKEVDKWNLDDDLIRQLQLGKCDSDIKIHATRLLHESGIKLDGQDATNVLKVLQERGIVIRDTDCLGAKTSSGLQPASVWQSIRDLQAPSSEQENAVDELPKFRPLSAEVLEDLTSEEDSFWASQLQDRTTSLFDATTSNGSDVAPKEKFSIPGLDLGDCENEDSFWHRYDTDNAANVDGGTRKGQPEGRSDDRISFTEWRLDERKTSSEADEEDQMRVEQFLRVMGVDIEPESPKTSDSKPPLEELARKAAEVAQKLADYFNSLCEVVTATKPPERQPVVLKLPPSKPQRTLASTNALDVADQKSRAKYASEERHSGHPLSSAGHSLPFHSYPAPALQDTSHSAPHRTFYNGNVAPPASLQPEARVLPAVPSDVTLAELEAFSHFGTASTPFLDAVACMHARESNRPWYPRIALQKGTPGPPLSPKNMAVGIFLLVAKQKAIGVVRWSRHVVARVSEFKFCKPVAAWCTAAMDAQFKLLGEKDSPRVSVSVFDGGKSTVMEHQLLETVRCFTLNHIVDVDACRWQSPERRKDLVDAIKKFLGF